MLNSILSPTPQRRQRAFLASLGLHALAILISVWLSTVLVPGVVKRTFSRTTLVAPLKPLKPTPKIPRVAINPIKAAPALKAKLFVAPRAEAPVVQKRRIDIPILLAETPPVPPAPHMPAIVVPAPVLVGLLEGTEQAPAPEKPVRATALGTFTATEAAGSNARPSSSMQIGAFEYSQTAGRGSRTGVVAVAGLDAAASAATSSHSRRVRTSSFETALISAPVAARASAVTRTREVEIVSKPRPEYSDEARKRKIEGEVALEILFTRTGEVRVIRVVRGLGFGLDQAAIRAAQGIRFKPAESDGTPIDATATVRIQFMLAF